MPEKLYTVRAQGQRSAERRAFEAAERDGMYVLRIVQVVPVGPWTEGDGGTFLYDVTVLGDDVPEAERRVMDGNR